MSKYKKGQNVDLIACPKFEFSKSQHAKCQNVKKWWYFGYLRDTLRGYFWVFTKNITFLTTNITFFAKNITFFHQKNYIFLLKTTSFVAKTFSFFAKIKMKDRSKKPPPPWRVRVKGLWLGLRDRVAWGRGVDLREGAEGVCAGVSYPATNLLGWEIYRREPLVSQMQGVPLMLAIFKNFIVIL